MNLIKFVYDSIESWLFCISIPTMTSLVRSCLFLTSSPNVANPMSVARRNGLPAKVLYCWGGWQKSHRKLRLILNDSVLPVTTLESPSLRQLNHVELLGGSGLPVYSVRKWSWKLPQTFPTLPWIHQTCSEVWSSALKLAICCGFCIDLP